MESSGMNVGNEIKKPSKEIGKKALLEAFSRNKEKKGVKYPKEINGPSDLEPTRYGDWERKGIVSDF